MFKLKNDVIEITVALKGAELKSIRDIKTNEEFMWDGNPDYWGKTAPVLFPFVGAMRDEGYLYNGKRYEGSRHGFARDNEFTLVEESSERLVFKFSENNETLKKYPFKFDFITEYRLEGSKVIVDYKVVNKDDEKMYFSLGGHPAFSTPVGDGVEFEDYYLEFESKEKVSRLILKGNLIADEREEFLDGSEISLTRNTFDGDAIIFEGLKSNSVTLKNRKNKRSVKVRYENFPLIGFWNVSGADFVCIEPWCGLADVGSRDHNLENKYAIEKLEGKEEFNRTIEIEVRV